LGLPDTRISGLPWVATTSRLSDKQVAVDAVDSPARCDFMKAVDGAADACVRVKGIVTSCPSTEYLFGGYSQGAAVIDLVT
jgi:cutinase